MVSAKISACFVILGLAAMGFGFWQMYNRGEGYPKTRVRTRRASILFCASAGAMILAVLTQPA